MRWMMSTCAKSTSSTAKEPVIVAMTDKNGQSVEKFYARSGNSSQEIPMSEMSSYVKERFK